MRVFILGYLFFLVTSYSFAQIKVKTFYEKTDEGFILYVNNNESIPISIQVKLDLDNLKSSDGEQNIYVVPAKSKKFKLSTLSIISKAEKFGVNISTNYNYGNHYLNRYEKNFMYCLPFQKGESYFLSQGYNGRLTHQNKNQLDFKMPIGTKIVAARSGLVLKVIDVNNRHCISKSCEKFNNYIYIYHDDGTIAEYVHIKNGSATIKEGEVVKKGQVIAESGNVGWSTGPHLHFSVFLQRLNGERDYIETKFRLDAGIKSNYLAEGRIYIRAYD